ncbi:GtrA family protein [Calidifontibacter indicus]|uniref:Putative flippase GtrA n=1 Tax=Calidifontibacter indicus TaxID=419650 RepID=A0A3D9V1S6_9MICO|nr:GtrA family protein [Calidifontibacter indicus]REF32124.1 putative flippase GtrA [Calidifontibacter indicus]
MTTAPTRTFGERLRGLVPQLMRFGVIGLVGLVVDVGGFNLLRFGGSGGEGLLHEYVLLAKVISSFAATVVAWVGNRYWTFRTTRREEKHHEFAWFVIVAVVGMGISLGCLWISHYLLGFKTPLADNISANGVGLVLATMFRFYAYRQHVFNNRG